MAKILSLLICLTLLISGSITGQTRFATLVPDQSTIVYQMSHPLHHIEAKSKEADYRLSLDPSKNEIKSITARVDVTTFDSGNSNRDSHAMEVIDAITFPEVNFSSTSVKQVGDSLMVTGKLTFHGITKEILVTGVAKWSPNKLELQGGFEISLTEFKIDRPSLLMIPVDDALKFLIDAVFRWD